MVCKIQGKSTEEKVNKVKIKLTIRRNVYIIKKYENLKGSAFVPETGRKLFFDYKKK